MSERLRVAVVTNIPAPYRIPVYSLLAQRDDLDFHAIYCSGREPDREWNLGASSFAHTFLGERFLNYSGRFIHVNHDVWPVLNRLRPDVVVTTGFNPTHLIAYAWARLYGARHVPMTDGTLESELSLTWFHRRVRRHVYANSAVFIGASEGSMKLFRAYGIRPHALFKSHLCADNAAFFNASQQPKTFDFMFCGRFVEIKNPLFALEVVRDVALRLGRRVSIAYVGSGGLEPEIRALAASLKDHVDTTFAGFARQEDLPRWYGAARIFLFPTQWDPWGVVANEACAAGVPVLVSPAAGSAGDLVRDGENGFVLPLQKEAWTNAAVRLLQDEKLYAAMSQRGRLLVDDFSYENAARGIADAVLKAAGRKSRPRVVIVQRRMTHYRVPLFEVLREKLAACGVELQVAFGDPTANELKKNDGGTLSWGVHVPCRYWAGDFFCWQNISPCARDADLVIVTQENRLLYNYQLLFSPHKSKVAYWGHGANFQASNPGGIFERWKALTSTHVDWWFAYSGSSVKILEKRGFARERITNLENAIDTRELREQLASITAGELSQLRQHHRLGDGPIAVFIGSLYKNKRIDFLLAAAERIAAKVPGFHLVVMGDGPLRDDVIAAGSHEWLRYIGSSRGRAKAAYLRLGDVFLNPGLVGLAILDAFVAGVVMVTTDCSIHSPEIDYLANGVNGVMTENSLDAYVDAVVRLLNDRQHLGQLRREADRSAEHYSIENMADNFCAGILTCLSLKGERSSA